MKVSQIFQPNRKSLIALFLGLSMGFMGLAQCTVDAGPDQRLTPNATLLLSPTTPSSLKIIVQWSQIEGPNRSSIVNSLKAETEVTGLIPGTYVYQFNYLGFCGFDSDTVTVIVEDGPDLELEAIASDVSPEIGDTVGFTLLLSNKGNIPATGVSVENLVPSGYGTITGIGAGGSYGTVTKMIGWGGLTVPVGGHTVSLSFNARVLAPIGNPGEFTHTSQVTASDQPEGDSAPNNDDGDQSEDDEASVTAAPVHADLSLTKEIVGGNTTPFVGDEIQFEIKLANAGPYVATNVVVVDQLLSGFGFLSYTATQGSYDPVSGFWHVGDLADGATQTLIITVHVRPTGIHSNTSQVTASDLPDPDSSPDNGVSSEDDQGDVDITPIQVVDLSLSMEVDQPNPDIDQEISFALRVENAGPATATSVVVRELLPSGFTYISDNVGGDYDPITGLWTLGTMYMDDFTELQIRARVNASGSHTNRAEIISHSPGDLDSTPDNDVLGEDDLAELVVAPLFSVDIEVGLVLDNTVPMIGDQIIFTATVDNLGPSDATQLVLAQPLADGYSFISAAPSTGSYDEITGLWTLGSLSNGATASMDLRVEVLPNGNYSQQVELIQLLQLDVDSNPGNNDPSEDDQQSLEPTVVPVSDLALHKSVNELSPYMGQEVTFTINLTNWGPSDAAGVEVRDLLPSGYTYVSDTSSSGTYDPENGIWALEGSLVDQGMETLSIVAQVNTSGDYFNKAEVIASQNYDPNSEPDNDSLFENDQDNAGTTPLPSADIELELQVDHAFPQVGSQITFTLTVANKGPSDALGVEVRDLLPPGFSYLSDDSGGGYNPYNGEWEIGDLANNTSVVLSLVATVNGEGDHTNVAELVASRFFDPDSSPDNHLIDEDDHQQLTVEPRTLTDISIQMEVDDMAPEPGEEITFTVLVENAGPNDATGLVIAIPLPGGYQLISALPSAGSYDPLTVSWALAGLDHGGSATLQLRALVLDQGPYALTAELIALDTFDPDSTVGNHLETEDDQASLEPLPGKVADLSISMAVDPVNPRVGGAVRFTILVRNHGPANARGVEVENLLPNGFAYQAHTSSAGDYDPLIGFWQVDRSIPVYGTETLEITALVNPPTNGADQYLNRAQITASSLEDPNSDPSQGFGVDDLLDGLPDNDEVTAIVAPGGVDLQMQITVDRLHAAKGDQVVFTITVTNLGPDLATHIGIEQQMPAGYEFIGSGATLGTYDSGSRFWEIGQLGVSESAQLELTLRVLEVEDYLARVVLSYLDQWDTNAANDSAEAFVVPDCLTVYNEFSPNGDGVNDYFKIDCIESYPDNVLQVFNRWGSLVFETKAYRNDWDGTPKGRAIIQKEKLLPVGTYYYLLDLGDGSGPRTDWLYINR